MVETLLALSLAQTFAKIKYDVKMPSLPATRLGRALRNELRAEIKGKRAAFQKEWGAEPVGAGELFHSIQVERPYVWRNGVSTRVAEFFYAGGAHPNTVTEGVTIALRNGKPRRLSLSDLFPKGDAGKAATPGLMRRLRGIPRAEMIQDGTIKSFSNAMVSNWRVVPGGLRFTFDPYAIASYAAGSFEVTVPFSELGPTFRRP